MAVVYLLLGTNLGNKILNLYSARVCIQKRLGHIQKTSCIYTSEAWGYNSEYVYYNQALKLETRHSPQALLLELQAIEIQLGRIKHEKLGYEDRTMDIDIIFYDNQVIHDKRVGLQVPHPRFYERLFAIYPVCEIIDSDFIYPNTQTVVSQMVFSVSGSPPRRVKELLVGWY